jgi:hypothetical protein
MDNCGKYLLVIEFYYENRLKKLGIYQDKKA